MWPAPFVLFPVACFKPPFTGAPWIEIFIQGLTLGISMLGLESFFLKTMGGRFEISAHPCIRGIRNPRLLTWILGSRSKIARPHRL